MAAPQLLFVECYDWLSDRQSDNRTPPPQPPHPVCLSEVETFNFFARSQLPPEVVGVGPTVGFGVLHHTQPQRPI